MRLSRSKQERVISNGKPEHAAYLLRKFFEKAEQHVRLFSGNLAQHMDYVPIFAAPEIIDAARTFLRKHGAKLSVVVAGDVEVETHPFIRGMREEAEWGFLRGSMTMAKASDEDAGFFHFQVMDDRVCRVETREEGSSIKALVGFNDSDLCEVAVHAFDRIHQRATPLFAVS